MASSTPTPGWYANCGQSWACCTWGLRRLRNSSHSNVLLGCEVSITGLCVETFDGPHTIPDLPHVVFPQVLLHLYPIAILGFLHIVFHLLSCCFHGLPVSTPGGRHLLVEASLDFPCGPWLIIRLATDRFNRDDTWAEVLVIWQAVCHFFHVPNMQIH